MNRPWLWIIAIIVVLALVGVGWWLLKNQQADRSQISAPTQSESFQTSIWTEQSVAVEGKYADADVLSIGDGKYRLYYSEEPEVQGFSGKIYSSVSTDGKNWIKEDGIRKEMSTFPDVVKLPSIPGSDTGYYRMYYQNAGVIKSATSSGGLVWKDEQGTRIDTNEAGFEMDNVAAPTTISLDDGTYLMVYRGTINEPYEGEKVPNSNTQILFWATSSDGITWEKQGIAIDSRDNILYGLTDGPELINADGAVTLSFWSYSGVFWSTFGDNQFSQPEKIFSRAVATSQNKFPRDPAGDPTYAKIGDTWYMYYGLHEKGIYYATRNN